MLFQSGAVAGIAVGAAVGSVLLTTIVFLLLRRYEALVLAKKEAMMAPIVRERENRAYWVRRNWLHNFAEENLFTTTGSYNDDLKELYLPNYFGGCSGRRFNSHFCIDDDAAPQFDPATVVGIDQAPHDIPAALSRYFDNQLDLGFDPRIIKKMLFDGGLSQRDTAIEFLFNKVALSFCNFGSNPNYALLPPKILELAEEIRVRGFKALDSRRDRGFSDEDENRFPVLYMRWRVLTCKLYGKDTMPPEVQMSIDRRVDFLLTVLGPLLKPETLVEAGAALQSKMTSSLNLALFCVSQRGLIINSWDFIGPSSKVVYVGVPDRIPRFDMMAEKTLVLKPAWLEVGSDFHGIPFVNPYVCQPAEVIKYTDEEWAHLTEG